MNFFDRLVDSFFAVLLIANYCKAAAVLSSEKFDKTALVGSNVELKCSLTDSHGHNLYWRKLSGVQYYLICILNLNIFSENKEND